MHYGNVAYRGQRQASRKQERKKASKQESVKLSSEWDQRKTREKRNVAIM
jgi:hypothetical protein